MRDFIQREAEGDLISRSVLLAEINGEENARADRLMREWYADMVERQPAVGAYTMEGIADAIAQADEGIVYAIRRKDRGMLEDVLRQYLDE